MHELLDAGTGRSGHCPLHPGVCLQLVRAHNPEGQAPWFDFTRCPQCAEALSAPEHNTLTQKFVVTSELSDALRFFLHDPRCAVVRAIYRAEHLKGKKS